MLSGHTMETTLFCCSLLRIRSLQKDFFSCVSGGGVRRTGSKGELHVNTVVWENNKHFLFYISWNCYHAWKKPAGQANFHDDHVCSLELSKTGHCGAEHLSYSVERWPWEIPWTAPPWRALGHVWSSKVLRKPTEKTAIDFLEQRRGQSLSRQQLEPHPVGWPQTHSFSGPLLGLFQRTLKLCLHILYFGGLRMELRRWYSAASTELTWSIIP